MTPNPPDAPDTEKLNKLLDALQRAAVGSGVGSLNYARKSVLDLFERLQNRIAELERRSNLPSLVQEKELESLRSENERLQGQCLEDLRLALEAQRERDALRSTALTRDEAADIIHTLISEDEPLPEPLLAKLRGIANATV